MYCLFSWSLMPADIYSSISPFECPGYGQLSNQVFYSCRDSFFLCFLVAQGWPVTKGLQWPSVSSVQGVSRPHCLWPQQLRLPESHKNFPTEQFFSNRKTPCLCRNYRRALDPLFGSWKLFVLLLIAHGKEINSREFLSVCGTKMARFIWTGPGVSWRRQKKKKMPQNMSLSFSTLNIVQK